MQRMDSIPKVKLDNSLRNTISFPVDEYLVDGEFVTS
jgi:hypothetical protein